MPSRRPPRRRSAPSGWPVLLLTALVAFAAGLYLGRVLGREERAAPAAGQEPRPAPPEAPAPVPPREPSAAERIAVGPPPAYPPAVGARLALLIDDLGRSLGQVQELAALGIPISYAVLPFEPRTGEVVERLRRMGSEILCHLPMEARNGADPGPGALTRRMSSAELAEATREALRRVPGAVGVNNHMGSGLSADPASMRTILGVVAGERLFYVDSRTTADSVGYQMALKLGIPAAERQVFLDAEGAVEPVQRQFARLLDVARERGAAVAIGHPSRVTLDVLAKEIPRARAAGYEFVPVSYLLDRTDVLPP